MLNSYLSNPPHFFKAYKSNINRAPRKKLYKITKDINKGSLLKILSNWSTWSRSIMANSSLTRSAGGADTRAWTERET